MQHQTPPEFETTIDFAPIESNRKIAQDNLHQEREDVSREVPLLLMRQEEPKHVATERYGNQDPTQSLTQAWTWMLLKVRSQTSESCSMS